MALRTQVHVSVKGDKALMRKLKKLEDSMQRSAMSQAVKMGAEVIRRYIQAEIKAQGLVDTGNLYDSVTVKRSKSKSKALGIAIYDVFTDTEYDWVHEYGATIEPTKAKRLVFEIDGRLIFAKSVTIPARPYFRPGVDAGRSEARQVMSDAFYVIVMKAAKS